jgi:hypothetical protein
VLLLALDSLISSLPEVLFDPDQAPEAEHDVALDDDHVSVKVSPALTLEVELLKVTDGAGVETLPPPPVEPPPPPPPPPQATRNSDDMIAIFRRLNPSIFRVLLDPFIKLKSVIYIATIPVSNYFKSDKLGGD